MDWRDPPRSGCGLNLTLAAIGRLKPNEPEYILTQDWLRRADQAGRPLGLRGVRHLELDPKLPQPDRDKEAAAFLANLDKAALVVALDEHGANMGSVPFSAQLIQWRDRGEREVVLAVGGPDGHGEALLRAATMTLSFGSWTWPHKLARAMAAEQIYRAISIMAGTPYHRV
ncbi:MAG: 23S rRNA (pseudouridine(1915)-N(3))-methyltransferase RlmH [Hyphomonadaceae bacterium]|nr:23S rRNA (pseudouridine(1915)-N(3))-methyltransferase RlmH [Hyphomonadaceae bacterium]